MVYKLWVTDLKHQSQRDFTNVVYAMAYTEKNLDDVCFMVSNKENS